MHLPRPFLCFTLLEQVNAAVLAECRQYKRYLNGVYIWYYLDLYMYYRNKVSKKAVIDQSEFRTSDS